MSADETLRAVRKNPRRKVSGVKNPDIVSLARLLFHHSSQEARFSSEDSRLIHVSDLFSLCPREYYLVRKLQIKKSRAIAPSMRLTFEMGKKMEEVVVQWLDDIGVVGDRQPELTEDKLGIIGHCDLRLKNGTLAEIKAKDPSLFRLTKNKPLARDQFQVQTYLWLDKTKNATLLTVTWGQERVPYRENAVYYNLKIRELISRTVSPIREAESGGKWPPRVCESRQSGRALTCPVADACFSQPSGTIKTIQDAIADE